jgi:phosphohistidine phosphatase SixA
MMSRRQNVRSVAALVVTAIGILAGQSAALRAETDPWAALRSGAIVLFRHGVAPGTGDPPNFSLGDCSTQRNLSTEGRAQSRRIGERLRTERVPVTSVLTSQWCRCVDTAELAFPGKSTVETAFNSQFAKQSGGAEQTERARAILAAWKGPGTLFVSTHQVNITALFGVVPAEGEGIVVRPVGGKLTVIGRIKP